ncbi:uncharacterized protein [Symphalangus syndactylus]|uniref:uncharacterized protein n=1 Tax=Symphalangus syndactylus TaxID=9590 RepID=UPI003005DD38
MSIRTKLQKKQHVIEALCNAKFKFLGRQNIHFSEKWDFTKFSVDEFEDMMAEKQLIPDSCGVKYTPDPDPPDKRLGDSFLRCPVCRAVLELARVLPASSWLLGRNQAGCGSGAPSSARKSLESAGVVRSPAPCQGARAGQGKMSRCETGRSHPPSGSSGSGTSGCILQGAREASEAPAETQGWLLLRSSGDVSRHSAAPARGLLQLLTSGFDMTARQFHNAYLPYQRPLMMEMLWPVYRGCAEDFRVLCFAFGCQKAENSTLRLC